MTMGYLMRSINLLNILLAAAAVAAAHYIVSPAINKERNFSPPAVKTAPAPAAGEGQKQKVRSEPAGPPNDFMLIADQNLFHPERKIPVEKPQAAQPPLKPALVLFGTLITGNMRVAYVDDIKAPLTTPGRGKRMRVLKIGDMVGDFMLIEIDPDKIILARGSEVMTVDLADPKGKRQRTGEVQKPFVNPNVRR